MTNRVLVLSTLACGLILLTHLHLYGYLCFAILFGIFTSILNHASNSRIAQSIDRWVMTGFVAVLLHKNAWHILYAVALYLSSKVSNIPFMTQTILHLASHFVATTVTLESFNK